MVKFSYWNLNHSSQQDIEHKETVVKTEIQEKKGATIFPETFSTILVNANGVHSNGIMQLIIHVHIKNCYKQNLSWSISSKKLILTINCKKI